MSIVFLLCGGFYLCCQAEDGIRDLVRSRGLGDVYKRQVIDHANFQGRGASEYVLGLGGVLHARQLNDDTVAVSYTHLTLPTSDLV